MSSWLDYEGAKPQPDPLLDECVKAFYVASETFDLDNCQFRLPDGTAQPLTPGERDRCNNYALQQQRIFADKARVSIHIFRDACYRFSLSPAWNELRKSIVNAPRKLQ